MKETVILSLILFCTACVSGPPQLTAKQENRLVDIKLYKEGIAPLRNFKFVKRISAADCSNSPLGGKVWSEEDKPLIILLMKAASLGADAVVNLDCGVAPLVNNCWAVQKCDGEAVIWVN